MKKLLLTLGTVFTAGSLHAATLIYTANLTGAAEAPPNSSPGTGFVTLTLDDVALTMRLQASFSGLQGTTSAAHIHAATTSPGTGTAGVATTIPSFVGFPTGVTSGTMDQTYDMTQAGSYNGSYISNNGGTTTTAFNALKTSIGAGTAYFNVHTGAFPGGEIRGFFSPVPEPATAALLGFGVLGLAGVRRRRG